MSGGDDDEVDRKAISDTSFEVELDEAPAPGRPPIYVDVTSREHDERPIIPAAFRGFSNIKKTTGRAGQIAARRSAFHAVRMPFLYVPQALWYAPVGAGKLLVRGVKFCFDSPSWVLQQDAVSRKDIDRYLELGKQREKVVGPRGRVALILALPALLAAVVFVALAPWWAIWLAVACAVPILARIGRPIDKPIIQTAVVAPRYRIINADVVLRAYYAAGLGHPDKPGQQVDFGSRMSRDALDLGSEVVVRLPIGKTFADAVKVKANIASGFDVTEQLVFLTRDFVWVRSQTLFVAYLDPLAKPAGRTPLLNLKPRDIWKPAPFGLDERGRKVFADLLWNSWLIGAQPRKGKALALDTKVPTPGGWTTMGELRGGDLVYDETGKPCRVVTAHDVRHDRPCYEVHFSDGSVIVADAEHLWQVDTRASRLSEQQQSRWRKNPSPHSYDQQHKRARSQVLTTADMLGSIRIQAAQRANYSVRVSSALQAPEVDLPVPPYTLGAWLGDGTTVHGMISCRDEEIIARIEQEGERTGLNPSTIIGGKCPGYRVYGLRPRLRQIGVLGNKHIPTAYLRASESQRRALLAGLLDTDGYCQDTGVIYFAVTNERLARDVRHLVSTLGYRSTINEKPAKLNGRDCGRQWLVTFTPADKVFGLARKACRQVTTMKASAAHRFITEIRPVPSVPVRCITVDSPSSLYLVGETCIATHNTFAARKLALYAALDPYVRMVVVDGKNSPDWRSFALVAHVVIFGTTPNRDGDPIELLLNTLREIKKDIQRRNEILSGLPVDKCPEGKLTRELSRSNPRLRVGILVMEEFQVYFETDDQEVNKEIAQLLSFIMAVGPSAGWIILSSSQKPSGVGAGDVQRLFNRYRDNHSVRFALKCGNRIVSDAVLGGDAYAEGYDASSLPVGPEYRGVGILYGMSDDTPIVRTYLADAEDAKKILLAARQHREAAGTLTGMAAGEEAAAAARDVLADVRRVFYSGEAFIAWQQLAARLAEQIPEHYADVSADSISAQMRAVGVESKDGRNKEYKGGAVAKGCRVAHVDAAIQRKQLESGGEP